MQTCGTVVKRPSPCTSYRNFKMFGAYFLWLVSALSSPSGKILRLQSSRFRFIFWLNARTYFLLLRLAFLAGSLTSVPTPLLTGSDWLTFFPVDGASVTLLTLGGAGGGGILGFPLGSEWVYWLSWQQNSLVDRISSINFKQQQKVMICRQGYQKLDRAKLKLLIILPFVVINYFKEI